MSQRSAGSCTRYTCANAFPAKIRASDKDLPVPTTYIPEKNKKGFRQY
jgi:hypothetical protein